MKICVYHTSGREVKDYGFRIIEEFNFKYYHVLVIEFNSLVDLVEFINKTNHELILTDSSNVICYNKEEENYSVDVINKFLNDYPFAVEIYDYYREKNCLPIYSLIV